MTTIEYRPEDFREHGLVTEDVIAKIIENVADFQPRYDMAVAIEIMHGVGIFAADESLFDDMAEVARDYIMERDWIEPYDYEADSILLDVDLELVFG